MKNLLAPLSAAVLGVAALSLSAVGPAAAPALAQDAAAAAPWQYPREFQLAGRRAWLLAPTLGARDAAAGTVTLRFPVKILDGAGRVTYGMTEAAGAYHTDFASRLVLVDGVAPGASAFPQLGDKDREDVTKALPEALPKELLVTLETLTAAPGAAPAAPATPPKLSMTAPEILVRRTPAVLVQIDGEPVKETVDEFPLEYVLNTAADLFHDPKSDVWYLLADAQWLEAKSLQGPWKWAERVPIVLSQLKVTHPRGHVRMFIPGTQEFGQRTGGKKQAAPSGDAPEVIVREKPAELVLLRGDPLFTMVPGVKLLAVANTASDMVYHPKSAAYFLCLSGRWFTAEDVNGPWKEAFGNLPEEFAQIPRDHDLGHLAWCVPGTPEAAEAAALLAMEERVSITRGTSVQVLFEGKEPKFVPVEGTQIKVATNTDDEMFLAEGAYWCCARGVWFRSDDGRAGWNLATELPKALEALPETSGVWHVRFTRALGASESGVSFAVSGGYSGVFAWKGAPVHGTGVTRRGLLRQGNWYPYPRTWGENRWYDPISGTFQVRTAAYGEDMQAVADEWSPYTASYGRVRQFADRYGQGGRRMFTFTPDAGKFDPAAGRPDPFGAWGTKVVEREGLKAGRFPLGDRSKETSSAEPSVVADAKGAVWRRGAKGLETWDGKDWAAGKDMGEDEAKWLAILERLRARPDQFRTWAAHRRAALPVNATVTK